MRSFQYGKQSYRQNGVGLEEKELRGEVWRDVQDITRLILRLALRVTASGDAKSFPTILSNLQQVLILPESHIAKRRL